MSPADYTARAKALAAVRSTIEELLGEARDILEGTGEAEANARVWLAHLDRATGSEETKTIDDTIRELQAKGEKS